MKRRLKGGGVEPTCEAGWLEEGGVGGGAGGVEPGGAVQGAAAHGVDVDVRQVLLDGAVSGVVRGQLRQALLQGQVQQVHLLAGLAQGGLGLNEQRGAHE